MITVPAARRPSLTALGGLILIVGIGMPVQVLANRIVARDPGEKVTSFRSNLIYSLCLGTPIAVAGWTLIRRHRLGLIAASVAAGAGIGNSAATLVSILTFFARSLPPWIGSDYLVEVLRSNPAVFVLHGGLLLGWTAVLLILLRPSVRREFPESGTGPSAILIAFGLSALFWYQLASHAPAF